MKYNRRVYAPKAAEHKLETNLQQTKAGLEEVFDKYMKDNCDKKGDIRNGNLTESMKKGIKDLREGGGVVMPTDKTGGLSYETKDSYLKAAKDHVDEDVEITEKVRKNTEAQYNGIGKALLRCLRVGESYPSDDRFVQAITVSNSLLPTLSLSGKDHKPITDPSKGPKR